MTPERYADLMWSGLQEVELTQEEIDEGWHFCPDWDYLLINPNNPGSEQCSCRKDYDHG